MWMGSMTIEQARSLEEGCVEPFQTETGIDWRLPRWLIELKLAILIRDEQAALDTVTQGD